MPNAVVNLIGEIRRRRTERVIYALLAMLGLGLVSLIWATHGVKPDIGARFVALSFLTALASFVAGAALGLLFGLPGRAGDGRADGGGGYVDRTTLEQIADWLTKIIVGVALTQLPSIERRFDRLTVDVTHDLYCPHAGAAGCGRLVGGSIIAAFAVGGFLIAYLWMRRWFILEMLDRDKQITHAEAAILKAKGEGRVATPPAGASSGQPATIGKGTNTVALAIAADAEGTGTGAAQATAAKIKPGSANDDPWLGVFGGSAIAGDACITAKVTDAADWPDWFEINLTVLGITPAAQAALAGQTALLYLHPTFGPKARRVGFGADGQARLQLFAWGAFTVGAILPDGRTLELNLAQLPGVSDVFRNR